MKINVWYHVNSRGHWSFASLQDECSYCYPADIYTLEEAKAAYIVDHQHERGDYTFIDEGSKA